ncbi:hypothetical protein NAC44_07850 [Allorhizobium sp. BGMRC 0089]|uniref:hypothetical protein n=1 Tax=Allorhizobium sonneratiae TaxID=2934936 RepID=UPI0020340BCA|nr:hypothetical protein [Allorhizobium sonneratiae]MCM2292239.1 hypothetical protein [Allorhizobium sonneratiae]
MQTALVVMTILGCNDSVSQCKYIATAEQRWVSVELCNGDTEKILSHYTNVPYPSVVAFCQTPPKQQLAKAPVSPVQPASQTPPPVPEREKHSLARRAIDEMKKVLPGKADIKMVFSAPIHVVTDSYAWAVRKLHS